MKISKLIKELEDISVEYGDKDVIVVQYANGLEGNYEYGHLVTEKDNLLASNMDLTNEIEIYTKTE